MQKLVDADFLDDEDLEKKVLPYIIKHSTHADQDHSDVAAPACDGQEGVGEKEGVETFLAHGPATACEHDHGDDTADDAAWFQLFSLLEKYGSEGMLERAFAMPPSISTGDDVIE